MAKGLSAQKSDKKAPKLSPKEKLQAKRDKKARNG